MQLQLKGIERDQARMTQINDHVLFFTDYNDYVLREAPVKVFMLKLSGQKISKVYKPQIYIIRIEEIDRILF